MCVHFRVSVAESSALKALQEKLFAHRSELIAAFQQYDIYNTGRMNEIKYNCTPPPPYFSFPFHFFPTLSQAGSPPTNGLK